MDMAIEAASGPSGCNDSEMGLRTIVLVFGRDGQHGNFNERGLASGEATVLIQQLCGTCIQGRQFIPRSHS
jgi:hypothetical protein